jgi:hypothetical protein
MGPQVKKAVTISVLDNLKSADILDQTEGQIKSGEEFFTRQAHFEYQKRKQCKKTSPKQNMQSGRPYSGNDRDIRTQYKRSNDTYAKRYTVPTSNRFEHLNC